ncbi:MAG: class I SAM-dependent methyltransferase [Alphaproteobacteria bacterium]|nr:class I SAM-dependent methyltransferase [Alphaproteobacteria bacterium]
MAVEQLNSRPMAEVERFGSSGSEQIPEWAWRVLASPGGGPLRYQDGLFWAADQPIGRIEQGIIRFNISSGDPSTEYYRSIGGAHFHERSAVAYAMTSLDTPVYHHYLRQFATENHDILVVDVGGGDGRNALPWLRWGFMRVVMVDSTAAALYRFRARVFAENPEWLQRLVLIECDARMLPLAHDVADRVLAIESLYYLNEDYEKGLAQCHRVMRPRARLFLSDRSYEGALLARLLYHGGVGAMLETARSQEMWDGEDRTRVRTRFFLRQELHELVAAQGFQIVETGGISALSLLLSFLSKSGRLGLQSDAYLPAVHQLLIDLGNTGCCSRCHVVIAAK